MTLLGGIAFLLQGVLTLISVIPGYLVTQIPIGGNRSVNTTPLAPETFLVAIGTSAVEILAALVVISSARAVYKQDSQSAKKRTSAAIVMAFIGVATFSEASVVIFQSLAGSNMFLELGLFIGTVNFADWGFFLTIAGAIISRWQIARNQVPEQT